METRYDSDPFLSYFALGILFLRGCRPVLPHHCDPRGGWASSRYELEIL